MRTLTTAIVLLTVAVATPVLAKDAQSSSQPDWDSCYKLGWDRGVHVELGELPGFMAQCMAGNVPFNNDAQ